MLWSGGLGAGRVIGKLWECGEETFGLDGRSARCEMTRGGLGDCSGVIGRCVRMGAFGYVLLGCEDNTTETSS